MKHNHSGFTLIEMAIVLMIIGLLVNSLLIPASQQMKQQKIRHTQQDLATLKETLIGFAIAQNRLPCPASTINGLETTGCDDNTEGYFPWRTLNLNIKQDAWGRPFRYRVDAEYATSAFPSNPHDTSSQLRIRNTYNSPNNYLTNEANNSNVVALIFSQGQNQLSSIHEKENRDADKIYIQGEYVESQFDDILLWLPKTILINRLVAAGKSAAP
jgi:prepilin-type N-terminal cleavage/methylation domain-containing protein